MFKIKKKSEFRVKCKTNTASGFLHDIVHYDHTIADFSQSAILYRSGFVHYDKYDVDSEIISPHLERVKHSTIRECDKTV